MRTTFSTFAFVAVIPTASSTTTIASPGVAIIGRPLADSLPSSALEFITSIVVRLAAATFWVRLGRASAEPLEVRMNVMTPRCPVVHKTNHKMHH